MSRNQPDDFGFSLIQKADQRAFQLEKMRSKLAGQSQGLKRMPKPKQKFLHDAFTKPIPMDLASSWAWKILIVVSLVIGNAAYLFFNHEEKARLAVRRMPKLMSPLASLDLNRQALYWTYALYDFDRLAREFGVPVHAIVDFNAAKTHLDDLLPRVDAQTRNLIQPYLPKRKRKA